MEPQPLGARVLLRVADDREHIWLPDHTAANLRAIVLAAGFAVVELSAGDVVLFDRRHAVEVRIPRPPDDPESVYLVEERDVLCILEPAEVPA